MYNRWISTDYESVIWPMSVPATPTPATPANRDRAAKAVGDGLRELIGGSPGIFNNRPDFIAGGGSNGPLPAAVRIISQANCRIWAASDKSNYSPRVNVGNYNLCEPYLDSIGELPDMGSASSEYEGGQCPVAYRVFATDGGFDLNIGGQTPLNIEGPLGVPTRSQTVVGSPFPDSTRYSWVFPNDPSKTLQFTARSSFVVNPNFRVAGRVDGEPDNCGNAPAENLRAPSRVTPVTPQPPRFIVGLPGYGDVNVNVDPNIDGDPVICIDELGVCFNIEVDGGGDGGGGGAGGGPSVAPSSPGEPGGDEGTGAGGEAEGEAPEGAELTGVLVEVLAAPGGANTFDNVSAQVFRGIGYVSMGYPGLLGVDTSAAVVNPPQFFHAQQRGLTAWRVRANVDFNLRVTPYYREIPE